MFRTKNAADKNTHTERERETEERSKSIDTGSFHKSEVDLAPLALPRRVH